MNPSPTSGVSVSRDRTERSTKLSLGAWVWNLITSVRLWLGLQLGKLVARPYARVVLIFVVGFIVGIAWHSYSGPMRRTIAGWSTYLAWVGPPAASASYDRMRADLVTARQGLDKLGSDLNRLEAQSADGARRRPAR